MEPDHNDQDQVLSDLVEYLVIQVPDLDSLASVGPAIIALTADSTIRILDLVAVTTDEFGSVHEIALDSLDGPRSTGAFVPQHGSLLSAHDIRLAALGLPAGAAGLVLVSEDRWAAPLDGGGPQRAAAGSSPASASRPTASSSRSPMARAVPMARRGRLTWHDRIPPERSGPACCRARRRRSANSTTVDVDVHRSGGADRRARRN